MYLLKHCHFAIFPHKWNQNMSDYLEFKAEFILNGSNYYGVDTNTLSGFFLERRLHSMESVFRPQ